jgi:hypothetical protein
LETARTEDSETSASRKLSSTPFSKGDRSDSTDNVSELACTPENKPIAKRVLAISPGSLKISFELAEARIKTDGILENVAWPKNEKERITLYRTLVFLYAMEFFWKLPVEDRMKQIQQCLHPKNVARLRRFAFSDASNKLATGTGGFEYYSNQCLTQRVFFDQERSFGGFPGCPFFRLQFSRNCYMVAACTWFSLKRQSDVEKDTPPLDIAHVARNLIIQNDEELIRRVVQDDGGNALDLAMKLTGTAFEDWSIRQFKFLVDTPETIGNNLRGMFEKYGFGLV